MRQMKAIYLFFLLLIAWGVQAQQLPQYSQYLFNDYAYNPSIAGSTDYIDARSNHRYQWIGVTDAPRTYTLSLHGPVAGNMGLGGYLFTDHVGPTRRTGLQLSYSYHITIKDDLKLSLGLSGGFLQLKLDGHKIKLHDAGDNVIVDGVMTALVPDAKFGMYLYNDNLFFGLSAAQILRSKIKFRNYPQVQGSFLENHFFGVLGYKFEISDDFAVEPSVMAKFVNPAPLKIDAMARVIYKDQLWLGGAYRTNDAFTAMIGYVYKKNIMLGFSYDFTTTNLKNYSDGTYELMLGIRFTRDQTFSKEGAVDSY